MTAGYRVEALAPHHDRKSFACGVEPLDRYLRDGASQDARRRVSRCFVALDASGAIAGYYSFAASSLPVGDLPADIAKRLPRYPLMPAALVGRLAVDQSHRGRGLGGALMIDAALRAARAEPAIFALIVEAKDETAAAFYEHLQFSRFASRPLALFLPLATALKAIDATGQ